MNNKTLTLNKKECNQVLEHALNTDNIFGYFMCNELSNGILVITRNYSLRPKIDLIIKNSFPEFTRENFLKFLAKNYPNELSEAKALARGDADVWLRGYSDDKTAIRKAFLRTLIKD